MKKNISMKKTLSKVSSSLSSSLKLTKKPTLVSVTEKSFADIVEKSKTNAKV